MITKEHIQAKTEELLEAFPKIKEIVNQDVPFIIRKQETYWSSVMTLNYEGQFGKPGNVYTHFDIEGNPTEMSIHDWGRATSTYISKDDNGKYIAKSKD
ncbi:hypothetical protein [Flavobacterium sp.]|uniref:hypothetical protein n=1 Tax=Flavobacterium sp. TaxID=239 RepID=UPI004047FA0F